MQNDLNEGWHSQRIHQYCVGHLHHTIDTIRPRWAGERSYQFQIFSSYKMLLLRDNSLLRASPNT